MQEIMSVFMFQLTTQEDIVNQNCSAYMLDFFFDITYALLSMTQNKRKNQNESV